MFSKAFKREPKFWFFTTVATLLSYGFALTNYSIGIDDEVTQRFTNENLNVRMGRWGDIVIRLIFGQTIYLPGWYDFFGVLFLVIGVVLWLYVFETYTNKKYDSIASIIFICIFISFPYLATTHLFMISVTGSGILMITSAASANLFLLWLVKKQSVVWALVSCLLLSFTVSLAENSVTHFLVSMFIVLWQLSVSEYDNGKYKSFRSLFSYLISTILMVILSILLWKVIGVILQKLFSVSSSEYTSRYILYDFNNFLSSFFSFLRSFISFVFIPNLSYGKVHLLLTISVWLILLISVYETIRSRNIIIFIAGIAIILSSYSFCVITGNINLPNRIFTNMAFLVSFTAMISYTKIIEIDWLKRVGKPVAILVIFILFLRQSRYFNEILYSEHSKYMLDKSTMELLMHDIGSIRGSRTEKPVLFTGTMPFYLNLPLSDGNMGSSIFRHDQVSTSDELRNHRIYDFINMHGYKITESTNYDKATLSHRLNGMPMWPVAGSVEDYEEYILVKLGPSSISSIPIEMDEGIDDLLSMRIDGHSTILRSIGRCEYVNNEVKISGWIAMNGVSSNDYDMSIVIANSDNVYISQPDKGYRPDVSSHYKVGNLYDWSGFSCSFIPSAENVASGVYKVYAFINYGNEIVYVDLAKEISIS
jgi:hypothetical protein